VTPTATHILDELADRGLLAQTTDEAALRAALTAGSVTFYVGFDPTAPSLHIGSLVQLLAARRLQRAGHRPIVLVGGATGLIGDPKPTSERTLNDRSTVAGWVERIATQVRPFLDFSGPAAATVVNNLDWTEQLSAIDLLRDIGRHFRVGRMLSKDAVATRLASEGGINYTEFSYQILQAYDFLHLLRTYGCTLQTSGSDQWGNVTAGLDLIHRTEGTEAHGLATPLILKADGTKFGKSEGGTVWLDPGLTSPYAFFQFFLQVEDATVGGYLRVFTDLDDAALAELDMATLERPGARAAQRALAQAVTSLVHGAAESERVEAAAAALFGRSDLAELDERTLSAALAEAPSTALAAGEERTYAQLLHDTGLVASLSEARRVVAEGGAYVNNTRLADATAVPGAEVWLHGRHLVLRRGKQRLAGVSRTL
jgi:tyrosyl-tRNA synthetase